MSKRGSFDPHSCHPPVFDQQLSPFCNSTGRPGSMAAVENLDKLLQLFLTHSHDAELHVRHTAVLHKLCSRDSGFAVRDLPQITQILDCTLDLVLSQHAAVFVEPACALIRAVGRPYNKQSSTDELRLLGVVTGLLKTLSRVFLDPQPWTLQACAAEVLESFASVWGQRPASPLPGSQSLAELDLQSAQRAHQTHQSWLHKSLVVPAMCSALQHVVQCKTASTSDSASCSRRDSTEQQQQQQGHQQQPELHNPSRPPDGIDAEVLVAALLSALLEFSYAPQLCAQQLQAGILPVLSQLLAHEAATGMNSRSGIQVIGLLWNLFELAPDSSKLPDSSCQLMGSEARPDASGTQQEEKLTHSEQEHCSSGEQQQLLQLQPDGDWQCAHQVSQQLVQALAATLQQQVDTCNSLQRQQQRNDTLTVLHLVSQCSSFLPAIPGSSSLLQLLLTAACTPDLNGGLGSTIQCNSNATLIISSSLAADHSMQLLAWGILGNAMLASRPCLDAAVQAGLLQLLLDAVAYGVLECGSTAAAWFARLTPEQLSASKQLAWSTLQQVAPLDKAGFIFCGGINVLLGYLKACSSSSVSTGSSTLLSTSTTTLAIAGCSSPSKPVMGTSVAGGTAVACSCSSAEPVLLLLRHQLHGAAKVAAAVVAHSGTRVLLQLLQAPAAATLTSVQQGVLLCLSELCRAGGRACMTDVREAGAVGLLLKECQSITEGDPYVPSLAALDCLWCCCIHSSRSRAQLLAADGMDTLLGLLQRGNPALRPVLLSLLADLLADKRSHPFFWEWHAPAAAGGSGWSSSSFSMPRARPASGSGAAAAGALHDARPDSKGRCSSAGNKQPDSWLLACCSHSASNMLHSGRITSTQLLVHIWRRQDELLGVSGPDGLLANPSRPLSGCSDHSRPVGLESCAGGVGGSERQVDVYGLMLPGRKVSMQHLAHAGSPRSLMEKVYACFAALGVAGRKDSSDVSLECLQALQQLPAADAATLVMIEQYMAFRQGEVWQDIKEEFSAADLQLTQEDRMRLESGIQSAEMTAAKVQAMQACLLDAAMKQQLAAERMVYDNMAAQAAADAKAKVYEKDSSKLTMRERLAAKTRKEDMLRRSCVTTNSQTPP